MRTVPRMGQDSIVSYIRQLTTDATRDINKIRRGHVVERQGEMTHVVSLISRFFFNLRNGKESMMNYLDDWSIARAS